MEQRLPLIPFFLQQIFIVHCAPGSVWGTLDIMSKTIQVSARTDLWDTKEFTASQTHMSLCLCTSCFVCQECPFPLWLSHSFFLPFDTQIRLYCLWEDSPDPKLQTQWFPLCITFIFFFIIYSIFMINVQELYNQRKIYGSLFLKEQIWMIPVWCLHFKLDRLFFFSSIEVFSFIKF